jgi:hypothetical protein
MRLGRCAISLRRSSLSREQRRERHRYRRTAEQRDELASFQLIELHSIPASQGCMQDIELARISQEVTERFYNLLAVGEGSQCPIRGQDSVIALMSAA